MKAWAVFTPKGKIIVETVARTRNGSVNAIVGLHDSAWWSIEKEGYTCRKIRIEEE